MTKNLLFLVILFGCHSPEIKLPDPSRNHIDEVRSDCESWLRAWVRDKDKIILVSKITGISELSKLETLLTNSGIKAPVSALRYKRIADRMHVSPMSEVDVITNIISVATELSQ